MIQQLPFAAKWTITESDLISLKDSANGRLLSTYVRTASGIQYCLQICPNGNRDENRGKAFVFLIIKIGSLKEVVAVCTIKVESANNFSRDIDHVYKESRGWGKCFCSTAELFDAQKSFLRDGKLELKVDGFFVFDDEKVCSRPPYRSYLGDDLWANEASKDFKIIADGKVIKAHKLILATMSPVFDEMIKSNSKEARKNQLTISGFSFHIVEIALKEIYGCNFTVRNTNVYDDTLSLLQFGDVYNILFLKEKYTNILLKLNGKRVPKLDGFLIIEINGSCINGTYTCICDIGDKLWASEATKDYKILVDGKAIMVHEVVLASRSRAYAAMVHSKSKEALKNQMEVCDFSFNIVELAMKAVYQCNSGNTTNFIDFLLVFQFLYKYDFLSTKNEYEAISILQIHAGNVCRLTNCAIITNSTTLYEKCMEFIAAAFASKTSLYETGLLDKNVALKVVQNAGYRILDKDAALKMFQESLYQVVQTRKENVFSSIMSLIK